MSDRYTNTIKQKPMKLAVVNDMAGYGRCSMAVALPVISSCSVQACPIPTSIYSNHTAYPEHVVTDLAETLPSYLDMWKKQAFTFDGLLCGFLNSHFQMEAISDFIQYLRPQGSLIVIDPVMGDHGKRYRMVSPTFSDHMKQFIKHASLLTPNLTEACILTDTDYKESPWSEQELCNIAEKLNRMGPENIVITGIKNQESLVNFIFESNTGHSLHQVTHIGNGRHGTGDIFSSIVSSLILRNFTLKDAVKIASDFIVTILEASNAFQIPVIEGVMFEPFLGMLTKL